MQTRLVATSAIAVLVLVATSCGGSADDDTASGTNGDGRTIEIEMVDVAFEPAAVDVRTGETVTFRFKNTGKVPHDAFIGDAAAQADHEREMDGDMGGMHHGDSGGAITVDPGDTATLTHTFHEAGRLVIGCHQPGHYDAGMKVAVNVA